MRKNRQTIKKIEGYYIYGRHAVIEALENPKRNHIALFALENNVSEQIIELTKKIKLEINVKTKPELVNIVGEAVHQGLVLQTQELNYLPFPAFVKSLETKNKATIVIADRISDPQNIGAILRNVAAFNADALLLPTHHAPDIGGSLAKAAAGALEHVPIYYQPNLVQNLQFLQKHRFWCYAAHENAEANLQDCDLASHAVFVLGSEGEGIRPLILKTCDVALKIPMAKIKANSLNVAATSAILLHHRFITP